MMQGHGFEQPILLDAGLGTRLIALGLEPGRDDPSLWNLQYPERVQRLHQADRDAGAQAIVTNTFGANRCWLDRFGGQGQVEAINRAGVRLARGAAGGGLVFGSLGPTATEEEMALVEQAEALLDAGVDALLIETVVPTQGVRALTWLRGRCGQPLFVSLRGLEPGEPLVNARAWGSRLPSMGADAIGVNCVEPAGLNALLAELADGAAVPLLARPSRLPAQNGETSTPSMFARAVVSGLPDGVWALGGCCGTNADDLRVMAGIWPREGRGG